MESLKDVIKSKGRPPPPPPKGSKPLLIAKDLTRISKKRGLGWPWDQPASHFRLFFPLPQHGRTSESDNGSNQKISWIFNWELWAPEVPENVDWVPCVRTAAQVGDILPFLSDIRSKGRVVTHLLGFNEPEISSQANLSVSQAVELWKDYVLPAKTQLGLRLGSPGMSSDTSISVPWLDEFFISFSSTSSRNVEKSLGEGIVSSGIEFLVLHWYGLSPADLITFLEKMHGRYQLPVWLNEFACSRMGSEGKETTENEIERFLREVIPWLEETVWIERYSFFGLGQGQDVGSWVGRNNNITQHQHARTDTGGFELSKTGRLYVQL